MKKKRIENRKATVGTIARFLGGTLIVTYLGLQHVQAAPVYLSCTFMIDGAPSIIDFTADEAVGTVSIFITASGHSRTVSGVFTPNQVRVEERDVRWIINREDLSIIRDLKIFSSVDKGQCQIKEPSKRIF